MAALPSNSEVFRNRFNRLVQDLLKGNCERNCFERWEVDLLLDIQGCTLRRSVRNQVLRRYQRTVDRQLQDGAPGPLRLSEYLEMRRRRPNAERNN